MSSQRPLATFALLSLLTLFAWSAPGSATVILVAPDGSGDYPTIQQAIDAAVPGDVVRLLPGTYHDVVTGSFQGHTVHAICFLKSGITLEGAAGAEATILDAEHDHRVLVGEGISTGTILRGLTFLGGKPRSGDGNTKWGGGILLDQAGPTVENCTFRDCSIAVSGGGGGGLLCFSKHSTGPMIIRSCLFEDNHSSQLGGAIELYQSNGYSIESCTFVGNSAGTGGAILLNASSGRVDRNIFFQNSGSGGAGVGCLGTSGTGSDGSCNLFWASTGPDVGGGCEAIVVGEDNNLEVDPLFCDVDAGDYRLQSTSPGSPAFSGTCGLIGALPVGCGPPTSEPSLAIAEVGAAQGAEVTVPITLNGYAPSGTRAYQMEIEFDPAILSFVRVEAGGTLSEGMLVAAHSPSLGRARVAAAGTEPIGSDGILLNLVFAVDASVVDGSRSPVDFASFTWGEGIPPVSTGNGGVTVGQPLTASGQVRYYDEDPAVRGVPGVMVALASTFDANAITDSTGTFLFGDLWLGLGFTVTPTSDNTDLSAVSSYDAGLVLGYLVQLNSLDANQQLAADVTGDGTVSAQDASRILQMIVDPGTAPSPLWLFQPESRTVESLPGSVSDLDFAAILRGDVSGNWCPTTPCDGPTRTASPAWTATGEWADGAFVVTVQVQESGTQGLDFALDYDASTLQFAEIQTPSGSLWLTNAAEGHLAVAGATAQPWTSGQPVVVARFTSVRSPARRSTIAISGLRIDEFAPQDGSVAVPGVNSPVGVFADFDVHVSPNPARGSVEFAIVGATGPVRVDVFNVAGRKIRSLTGTPDAVGVRTLAWDRRDGEGSRVADGIYFVRANLGGRAVTKRVVLVQ